MTRFIIRETPPNFSEVASEVSRSVIAFAVGLRSADKQPNIVGTGFALEFSEYFATCLHVAEEYDRHYRYSKERLSELGLIDNKLRIALPDGNRKYHWREMETNTWFRGHLRESDVCIWRFIGLAIPPLALFPGQFLFGSDIGILGFPLGNYLQGPELRPLVLKSIISGGIDPAPSNGLLTGHLVLGTSVAGGFSGGPVFSVSDGTVVGMVASKTMEVSKGTAWPAGLSLAVTPQDLNYVLQSGLHQMTVVVRESVHADINKRIMEFTKPEGTGN